MGKATRWLKGLLGMKKDKENVGNSSMASPDKKERKRWSFAKSGKVFSPNSSQVLGDMPVKDTAWSRSYMSEKEKEQNKHAIAVAAASAAAADVAVAAAQAAAAVVRLTSNGRGTLFNGGRERWAAVKIQTFFRGFLARKALGALKALVKLQALVRGYLIRKRTAATLHSMQVLLRAQAAVRYHRARRSVSRDHRFHPESRGRRSMERFDEPRSEFHSKRIATSYDVPHNTFDESPKIVEMDTCRPRSRSRRINIAMSECGEDPIYQAISSPVPSRYFIPECRQYQESECSFGGDECRFSTTHNTPRFANWMRSPATPSKSVCRDSCFTPYPNSPSYMANTQSFRAKLRSLSAPKQRPEQGSKKKLSLTEILAARNSMSGVRMQRSGSRFQESRIF